MLVFDDWAGCEAFVDYMLENHQALAYENHEDVA
jgi:hypothetical protein